MRAAGRGPVAAGLAGVLLLLHVLVGASAAQAGPARIAESGVRVAVLVEDPAGRVRIERRMTASTNAAHRLVADLRRERGVLAAGVRTPVRLLESLPDPLVEQQWALTRLQAQVVWQRRPLVRPMIAVLDTGVDRTHPDLADVVLTGTDLLQGGDGGIDPHGHGTHVAGVAAAVAENGQGGAGLAQGVDLLPVRVLDAAGAGWDDVVAEGVLWATERNAAVINLSLGTELRSEVLDAAIAYALARGVTVVAAAGNGGPTLPPMWPASTPGVIGVGATRPDDLLASFSATGPHIDLVAPGVGIISTAPGNRYATRSGTSMAAPFAAAAAALLLSDAPDLDPAAVSSRLAATAIDLGPSGRDPAYGSGLLDVVSARTDCAQAPDQDADGVNDVCDLIDDVPTTSATSDFAERVVRAGISAGCARSDLVLDFCPGRSLTRAEVAVWLLRATGATASDLTPYDGSIADVPADHALAAWAAELLRRGITAGCGRDGTGRTLFCPDAAVTRQELAVLLLRSVGVAGADLAPYDGRFADVSADSPYSPWIRELSDRGITSGCATAADGSAARFCPTSAVSRGQAAVLLSRAFGLDE